MVQFFTAPGRAAFLGKNRRLKRLRRLAKSQVHDKVEDVNAPLPTHEMGPRDPAWRELSPEQRFRVLQTASDDNKTARQRVIASLKRPPAPEAKNPGGPKDSKSSNGPAPRQAASPKA